MDKSRAHIILLSAVQRIKQILSNSYSQAVVEALHIGTDTLCSTASGKGSDSNEFGKLFELTSSKHIFKTQYLK